MKSNLPGDSFVANAFDASCVKLNQRPRLQLQIFIDGVNG